MRRALLLLVLAVLLLTGCAPKSPTEKDVVSIADKYINAYYSMDIDELSKYYPISVEDFIEQLSERDGYNFYEQIAPNVTNYDQFCTEAKRRIEDVYKENYGDNYKVEFNIRATEKLSESEVDLLKNSLDYDYEFDHEIDVLQYLDIDKIEDAYRAFVVITVNGENIEEDIFFFVYYIDGKPYVFMPEASVIPDLF